MIIQATGIGQSLHGNTNNKALNLNQTVALSNKELLEDNLQRYELSTHHKSRGHGRNYQIYFNTTSRLFRSFLETTVSQQAYATSIDFSKIDSY